jgi:hypothetical protein
MGNLLIYSAVDNFCILQLALPCSQPCRGSEYGSRIKFFYSPCRDIMRKPSSSTNLDFAIEGSPARYMRNNSAPSKWSKRWTDIPRPGDHIGAYSTEQLEEMNQEFTAAVERAFRAGDESEVAAAATYDFRKAK